MPSQDRMFLRKTNLGPMVSSSCSCRNTNMTYLYFLQSSGYYSFTKSIVKRPRVSSRYTFIHLSKTIVIRRDIISIHFVWAQKILRLAFFRAFYYISYVKVIRSKINDYYFNRFLWHLILRCLSSLSIIFYIYITGIFDYGTCTSHIPPTKAKCQKKFFMQFTMMRIIRNAQVLR